MSITLGINKGKSFDSSNSVFVGDVPVSFQRVWNDLWQEAINYCGIHFFKLDSGFTVDQIPEVLIEIDKINDWVLVKGGNDKEYISKRICNELKPFLDNFYHEHKDEDYWFDLG